VSDAAPLPRLGEVFFDVRGNSRSMRLSWYADTGVAVFSIWQAGMCTGTFRLPIGDLSRMIEILERGPSPQSRGRAPVSAAHDGPERGRGEYRADDEIGLLDSPRGPGGQGGYAGADYAADYGRSAPGTGQHAGGGPAADYGPEGYGEPGYEKAGYETAGYEKAGYETAGYEKAGYEKAGYEKAGYEKAGYEKAGYADAGHSGASYGSDRLRGADYSAADYQPADYGAGQPDAHEPAAYDYYPAGYGHGGYGEDDPARRGGHAAADYTTGSSYGGAPDYLTGEHPVTGYREGMRADGGPDYRSGGYGSQPAFPAGGRQRDDSRFPPDPGGLPSAESDGIGYPEERFVPPYVGGGGDSYLNDNRAEPAGYESDRDDAGYPADTPPVSPADGYHEAQWPGEAYSYGAEYRRR
jgi:hypothetical protein